MLMPPLQTERLLIREFTLDDLDVIHQLLDIDLSEADFGTEGPQALEEREQWLRWAIMNYAELAKLYQPPYGDRAVVLKATGGVIGSVGYVQCLYPFDQLPGSPGGPVGPAKALYITDFGLYYAFAPAHQRQGYATEATKAMINYAFRQLHLKRIVATTSYDNAGSMGVMRKVGMRIERNPFPDPPWFQVVGILDNQG